MLFHSTAIRMILSVFILTNTLIMCPCSLLAESCGMSGDTGSKVKTSCSACHSNDTKSDEKAPQKPCDCNHDMNGDAIADVIEFAPLTAPNIEHLFILTETQLTSGHSHHHSPVDIRFFIGEISPPSSLIALHCCLLV